MEIETPVLLAYAIEDSTDIFRISGGFEHPKLPLGTPLLSWKMCAVSEMLKVSINFFFPNRRPIPFYGNQLRTFRNVSCQRTDLLSEFIIRSLYLRSHLAGNCDVSLCVIFVWVSVTVKQHTLVMFRTLPHTHTHTQTNKHTHTHTQTNTLRLLPDSAVFYKFSRDNGLNWNTILSFWFYTN